MNQKHNIEILAPAGSYEALKSEIHAGADAVYVGGSHFGARAFAENLSTEQLCEAIDFVHIFGKKLYLTVNTLLTDTELEHSVYDMLAPLYEQGLDAVIVQDMGVLSFVHNEFPEIDIHASTQMTLCSAAGTNMLGSYGVTRFVPARELTIEEIKGVRKQTNMEIEVFVHGALCYSYSGQCLMSSIMGGRSGNRGMCAQPCRLPYEVNHKHGFFLSPKDVCTLTQIPELVDAGIDSFKIEGRMKSMEYGILTAKLYRQYTDFYIREGREAFERETHNKRSELWQDIRCLKDLYNRGDFCKGYLFEEEKADIIFPKKNNHYGVRVGSVVSCNGRQAVFHLEEGIEYQDVLEFRKESTQESLYEYTVKNPAERGQDICANIMPGSLIQKGQAVYRIRNQKLRNKILSFPKKKRMLHGVFIAEVGKELSFSVQGTDGSVSVYGDRAMRAMKRAVTEDEIRTRLMRTGETDYQFHEIEIKLDSELFIPMGEVNRLRRDALETYERQVLGRFRRKCTKRTDIPSISKIEAAKEVMVTICNEEQLEEAKRHKEISTIVCNLAFWNRVQWKNAVIQIRNAGKKVAFSFPKPLHGIILEKVFNEFPETEFDTDMIGLVNSWEMWSFCIRMKIPCCMDTAFYVTNQRALFFYHEQKAQNFCVSVDSNDSEKRKWSDFGGFVTVYGKVPLMTTKACVSSACTSCDSKPLQMKNAGGDEFFVVKHCNYCYNTIYTNETKTDLGEYRKRRFDFLDEDAFQIRKVLKQWKI